MSYQQSFDEFIETAGTIRPNNPQVQIKNPLKKDIFVNAIELLPDAEFVKKGEVIVTINDITIFNTNGKPIGNYALFPIPLDNQEFFRDKFIKIFAWNRVDSNLIKLGINMKIGETSENLAKGAQAIDQDSINRLISDFEILFPTQLRSKDTVNTQLIDMRGHNALILMLSSAVYSSGATVLVGGASIIDGNLDTYGGTITATNTTPAVAGAIDFGSIASRVPKGRGKRTTINGGNNYNWELQVSNDNNVWTTVSSADSGSTNTVVDLEGAAQSFRYLRLRLAWASGTADTTQGQCGELYDASLFGGTAEISFEVFDSSSNNWLELISATSIGALSQGQSFVKTIGDTINDVSNNKFNFKLPKTQTKFRAKLTIKNASISVGVSIAKVA